MCSTFVQTFWNTTSLEVIAQTLHWWPLYISDFFSKKKGKNKVFFLNTIAYDFLKHDITRRYCTNITLVAPVYKLRISFLQGQNKVVFLNNKRLRLFEKRHHPKLFHKHCIGGSCIFLISHQPRNNSFFLTTRDNMTFFC